jgi:two-component system, response regulator
MDNLNTIDILLIEDNPNDVELTLRAFRKNNIVNAIHVVSDGAEALEFLFAKGRYQNRGKNHKPRIILLDLKLPKVDGLEVLKTIKGDERLKTIPVVVLTSSTEEQDIVKSHQLGVNSYIVKPTDFEKFTGAISGLGLYWLLLNHPPQ